MCYYKKVIKIMQRVDVKLGFQCNNRCRFCVQGNKREEYSDKTTKEIKRILREARKKHEGLVFTGGEPTIRKDLPELVEYARELEFKVIQIQTNGRMFAYKKFCEDLIKKGANEFALALHGHNAKLHDGLTTVPGSFEQTTSGIKNLKSLGQPILMNTVITKPNYKFLPQIARLLVDLGVNQFQFAFMHINHIILENRKLIDEIVPRKSDVMPYVKKGLQIGINAGINVMTEAIPYCFMEGYEDYIAEKIIPDGAVYDADWAIQDYGKYRRTEGKLKGPNCSRCKYFKICEGPWKEYPQIFGWEEFKPIKK